MTLLRPDDFDAEKLPIHDLEQGVDGSAKLSESAHHQPGSVEFSRPMESSDPQEAPKDSRRNRIPTKQSRFRRIQNWIGTLLNSEISMVRYITVPNPPTSVQATDERSPERPRLERRSPSSSQPVSQPITPATLANKTYEVVIPLLDERVVVARLRRKVGEIVIRKEVETHMVEVPIRREKLIIEQVSPEYLQIAVVELGQAQVTEFDTQEAVEVTPSPTVSGEFASANAAIHFLEAIGSESDSGLQKVQLRVVLEDAVLQKTYQRWLDQYSTDVSP